MYSRYFGQRVCENVNNTSCRKNCLLLYLADPFRSGKNDRSHQNIFQSWEMVKVIGEFGYNVDVINFYDRNVALNKRYDMVVDIHPGFNRVYEKALHASCVKIAYMTGPNPNFTNKSELSRLDELYKRKGVRLKQRRYAMPLDKNEIESFDAVIMMSNEHNFKTYDEFMFKRVFLIKNTAYSFLKGDDFSSKNSSSFLFLASLGQVHRGLDLLLEVFSRNQQLNLFVCSPFKHERDFCKLYKKELFHSKNISPIGFLDIEGKKFRDVVSTCAYVVLPSCSEGIAGSVLTAMSAGVIPIVSMECGLEEDEVQHFTSCKMEDIERTLLYYSGMPIEWVRMETLRVMNMTHSRYSESKYAESIRNSFASILQD